MIEKVIICGTHRTSTIPISEIEIRQMIGRCGREYDNNEIAEAIVVVKKWEYDYAYHCLFDELPSIESGLVNLEDIVFHLLPHIYSERVKTLKDIEEWYSKSFAFFQGYKLDVQAVVNYLLSNDLVKKDDDDFFITELGKISCKFYYRPYRVIMLKRKFEKLCKYAYFEEDSVLAWALADKELIFNIDEEIINMFDMEYNLPERMEEEEKASALIYFCLLKNYKPKNIRFLLKEYKNDIDRLINMLLYMDKVYKWNISNILHVLLLRIKKNVNLEVAKLMLQSKIYNKSLIMQMIELGYSSIEEIIADESELIRFGHIDFLNKIKSLYSIKKLTKILNDESFKYS